MLIESNLSEYVDLMAKRALGQLPEMGSAIRTVEILNENNLISKEENSILDVGSATCHYLRTFLKNDIKINLYAGIEIDKEMVKAAKSIWADEISKGKLILNNSDVEKFSLDKQFDICICCNAFMYFKSPYRALENMLKHTKNNLLIRGYFSDKSYRILRSQTSSHHDKSNVKEADSFNLEGDLMSFDYWSIYSKEYIESVVNKVSPKSRIKWIEDKNYLNSINDEKDLNVKKRDGTFVLNNMEISYPFIQPWEYLLISL